jgi:HAD superfamily phosphoserine phosphatase-like hydrolase
MISPEKQRPFAVFDIDGTWIRWQLYHATADRLVQLGYIGEEEYAPIRAARMDWKNRKISFKVYEHKLVTLYGKAILDLTVGQVNEAMDRTFDIYKDQAYTYPKGLAENLRQKDYLLFAVSGSQDEIVTKFAQHNRFDDSVGSIYVNDGEHFSGETILPLGRKDKVVEELIKKHNATLEGSFGMGDSMGDIAMLEMVHTPIAFNPENPLFKYADQKGWDIVTERKDSIDRKKNGRYQLVDTEDESAYIF